MLMYCNFLVFFLSLKAGTKICSHEKIYNSIFPVVIFLTLLSLTCYSSVIYIEPDSRFVNYIEEDENLSIKKMYPNPVKDKLTVEFQIKNEGDMKIKVYDILGNEVITKDVYMGSSGLNRIIFDLSDLRPGIYILKAVKDSRTVSVRVKKQ